MKIRYKFLSLCMVVLSIEHPLNAADSNNSYWKYAQNLALKPVNWLLSKTPSQSQAWNATKLLARKPTTWAVLGLTGYGTYQLGNALGSQQNSVVLVGTTFGALTISTFINWMRLRTRFLELEKKQTSSSDPYVRNAWHNPLHKEEEQFKDGFDMIVAFNEADQNEKKLLRQAFLNQLSVNTTQDAIIKLDGALEHMRSDLAWYCKYTNIQYLLSLASGFTTPDELLTSDALIKNSLEVGGALRNNFDEATEFGLYSIRRDWLDKLHIPFPTIYTWNYSMASWCVWLSLQHYSFLKAIRKIMESSIVDSGTPNAFVYLKERSAH